MQKKTFENINKETNINILYEYFGVKSMNDLGNKISSIEMDKLKENNPGIWFTIKLVLRDFKNKVKFI